MSNSNHPQRLYQIGDFSKLSRISIKALRHYQEIGLLEPSYIDEETAYRYYAEKLLRRATEIQSLRHLEFSLKEIVDIFENMEDDDDLVEVITRKSEFVANKITQLQNVQNQLKLIIENNKRHQMSNSNTVKKITIPDQTIACVRFKGEYSDVGIYFKKIFKEAGFKTQGKPATLYYDDSYKDKDADMECYVPVKSELNSNVVRTRLLAGGTAYSITHIGPYDTISLSYKILLDFITEKSINAHIPSREIYHKGPGMIFKGNPEKYITELQILVDINNN